MEHNNTKSIWYREPFVWLVLFFPALAVVAGFITLRLAIVSDDGLVVDDYYQQGKEINLVLGRDEAAATRGYTGALRLDYQQNELSLALNSRDGSAAPEQVSLKWLHATRGGNDHQVLLPRSTDGVYRAPAPKLAAGHWHLQIEAQDWRLTGALTVPLKNIPALYELALAPRGLK
jgi:hypothetical protein